MNVTVNGKNYSRDEVHRVFEQGRRAISDHSVTDDRGYIGRSLAITELCAHLIGSIPELSSYVHFERR